MSSPSICTYITTTSSYCIHLILINILKCYILNCINVLKFALADLRTNSKIGPLVPYFLNLVALSVNKLQRHGQLTEALLRTVEALVDNPYVDPSSQLAVKLVLIYFPSLNLYIISFTMFYLFDNALNIVYIVQNYMIECRRN